MRDHVVGIGFIDLVEFHFSDSGRGDDSGLAKVKSASLANHADAAKDEMGGIILEYRKRVFRRHEEGDLESLSISGAGLLLGSSSSSSRLSIMRSILVEQRRISTSTSTSTRLTDLSAKCLIGGIHFSSSLAKGAAIVDEGEVSFAIPVNVSVGWESVHLLAAGEPCWGVIPYTRIMDRGAPIAKRTGKVTKEDARRSSELMLTIKNGTANRHMIYN